MLYEVIVFLGDSGGATDLKKTVGPHTDRTNPYILQTSYYNNNTNLPSLLNIILKDCVRQMVLL